MHRHSFRNLLRLAGAALSFVLIGLAGVASGGGGATGTGYMAFGEVTDFGSIFVNGIEFFTSKAVITINGETRSESDLRIGMVLKVYGTLDGSQKTGTAQTVDYHADALGPLDAPPIVTATGGSFSVLGQTVTLGTRTVFSGFLSLADLHQGDFVEVSAFRTDTGLLASRIERKTQVAAVQVQGTIANTTATTFTIGPLTVDYSQASRKNVPSSGLVDGLIVVAKGLVTPGGVLAASSIEVLNQSVSGTSAASVSGVISLYDGSKLVVNGEAISVSPQTQYVNGSAADLAAGKLVKVDVVLVGNVPVATKIEFLQLHEASYLEGDVTAKSSSTLELLGPGGAIIEFNSTTQFQDKSDAKLNVLTFANLDVGDHLQVKGNQVDFATLLADKVIRTRPSTAIVLEGRALNVAAPSFTVVDIEIATDGATDLRDATGTPVTADVFFSEVAGHEVIVNAVRTASGFVAISARID